jgi:hypothetical protein
MSAEYVRRMYRVDFKRGERVETDWGATGTIASFPQQYVGIRFDGERFTSRVHPLEVHRLDPDDDPNRSDR